MQEKKSSTSLHSQKFFKISATKVIFLLFYKTMTQLLSLQELKPHIKGQQVTMLIIHSSTITLETVFLTIKICRSISIQI